MITVNTWWNDAFLRAKPARAMPPAVAAVAAAAKTACVSSRVAAGIVPITTGKTGAVTSTHPLGAIIEGGAKPHSIAPHNQAIKFNAGDGGFVSVPVQHPGQRAHPFLKPSVNAFIPACLSALRAVF